MQLCNHHHNEHTEQIHHLQQFLHKYAPFSPLPLTPAFCKHWSVFSPYGFFFSLLSLNSFTEHNAVEPQPCFCWHWIPGFWRWSFLSDPVPPVVFWELKQFGPPKGTGCFLFILAPGAMGFHLRLGGLQGSPSPRSSWFLVLDGQGAKWTSAPPSEPSADGGFVLLDSPAFSLAHEFTDFQDSLRAGVNFPHGLRSQWLFTLRPATLCLYRIKKKIFIWISPYNLHGDPDFFPLPRKKWCSHPICPWRCPSFLRNQASWLHCNLSS